MNDKLKLTFFCLGLGLIMVALTHTFWQYEVKYAMPTPVPIDHKEVCIGEKVPFEPYIEQGEKPILVHFFNPSCPCSKFNIKELFVLKKVYGKDVDLAIVLESELESDVAHFKKTYGTDMDVLLDRDGAISDVFGVYSTPQAVILDKDGVIYYKGNYNKARFCTNKDSRFVDDALQYLIAGKALPVFTEKATIAYGCTLPSDERKVIAANSLYKRVFQPWSN